jgi:hypothetical protein
MVGSRAEFCQADKERDADQFRFQFGRSAITPHRAGRASGPGPLDSPPAPNDRGHTRLQIRMENQNGS